MSLETIKQNLINSRSELTDSHNAVGNAIVAISAALQHFEDDITPAEVAPPPPAEAPPEPEFDWVATQKLIDSGQTIQDYLDAKWDYEQMEAEGLVVEDVVDPKPDAAGATTQNDGTETPAPATAPPPPAAEVVELKMTALADGNTYQDLLDVGWDHDQMVAAGYIEIEEPAEQTFPWKDEDGNWIDKSGAVHDPDKHAATRNGGAPPLKADGNFKASRKKKPAAAKTAPPPPAADVKIAPPPAAETKAAPPPPPAAEEEGAAPPPPPPPPAAATPESGEKEVVDPALEDIMSNFNSEGGGV